MKEIMGYLTKTECHWKLIKYCGSEYHKPQTFIGDREFKAVIKFCCLMNRKIEFQIKKFSTWFWRLIISVGPPFNITSFKHLQTSNLHFGLANWTSGAS